MPPRYALPSLNDSLADFIESISSLLDRQHALSVLSRTSKTYNTLLSHKLYLRPVLTSEKRVELWSRTYWARSNPWNLCDPKMSFKEVIVPVAVSLDLEFLELSRKKLKTPNFRRSFGVAQPYLRRIVAEQYRDTTNLSTTRSSSRYRSLALLTFRRSFRSQSYFDHCLIRFPYALFPPRRTPRN